MEIVLCITLTCAGMVNSVPSIRLRVFSATGRQFCRSILFSRTINSSPPYLAIRSVILKEDFKVDAKVFRTVSPV